MRFYIYLKIESGKLYFNAMEPKDMLTYEFTRETIVENATSDITHGKLVKLNKIEALKCHRRLMELRLKIKSYSSLGTKLIHQEKYYVEVLSSYLDFFEELPFQLPRIRLDIEKKYALDLKTGDSIRLSRKQSIFVDLYYDHFINSKIGNEWMWFSEAYNKLNEDVMNPAWNSMTDIFEKRDGKEKLDQLFDVKTEGSKRYYRIKSTNLS
jgi:hypothetical protein